MYFSVYHINTVLFSNIKYSEAMTDDCLKSNNFYMCNSHNYHIISHVKLSVLSVPEIPIKRCTLYNKIR